MDIRARMAARAGAKKFRLNLAAEWISGDAAVGAWVLIDADTEARDQRFIKAMSTTIGGVSSANDYGWIIIDPSSKTLTKGITQAFPTGELWGINSQVFVPMRRTNVSQDELGAAFGVISAEKLYTRTLENYVAAAAEMKRRPPFVVELGAAGLRGVYMGAPHPEFSTGHYYGPVREKALACGTSWRIPSAWRYSKSCANSSRSFTT